MSSAGHVLDMIQRINNNRNLQKERHSQYAKVKKAYQKFENKHTVLNSKQEFSTEKIENIRNKIKEDIRKDFKKTIILTSFFASIAIIITISIILKIIAI